MFNQFFIFFTLIGIGYLSRKKNWLDEASIKGVGNLLINVAIPALLLSSIFALDITGDLLIEFASMSLLSIAFFTLYAIFAAIYVRLRNIPSERKGIVQFFMITTNNGFIGLPISAAFLEKKGSFS
jgi:predicted permease